MSLLKPFSKLPDLNTANILVSLFFFFFYVCSAVKQDCEDVNLFNLRLAKSLPLPMENDESRPRIDLVVFIINLTSDKSFESAKASLKYLDPGYFLGKVCFVATNARHASVRTGCLDALRQLAALLHCPLLFAEDQSPEGATSSARRLLTILKVASGLVPNTTALYLSSLTRCTMPPDIDQPSFD
uniref:Centromere protein M n=1 Tax=Xiphophorus couchianus TaxID=32473 RepID=A0A3B5MDB3_9TELE